jgi:hypothetical protein
MSHRRGMIVVVTIFAVCCVFAATAIVHYDETHGRHRVPGTPFTLRDGPSKTPARFAPWNRWAEAGLIAFQRYADRSLGGGIRQRVDVVLNRTMECDGRTPPIPVDGEAADHTICLYLDGLEIEQDPKGAPLELALTAAHEAAHIWSGEHGCATTATDEAHPDRFDEGMASDLAWHALEADGSTARAQALHLADLRRAARSLRRAGSKAATDLLYVEGEIRAHLLEDGHPERYATYCRVLAATGNEGAARKRAFGRF